MHEVRATLVLVLTAALAAVGCSASNGSEEPTGSGSLTTTDLADGVQLVTADVQRTAVGDPAVAGSAMAAFGVDLWHRLPADGNLAISPYSIYAVLAMARAGATGATATELDAILGAQSGTTMTTVDGALQGAVVTPRHPVLTNEYADERSLSVETANSLWAQHGLTLKGPLVSAMGADFGAGVRLTDYAADPEASRAAINAWVAEITHGLIPELCPSGSIDSSTLLTLVNAVYFAGSWEPKFYPSPEPLPFTTDAGPTAVPAFGGVAALATAKGDGWESVTIPYVGGGAAMTLIVPAAGRFADVQDALGPDLLTAARSGAQSQVWLTMPVFNVDTATSVTAPLTAMAPAVFNTGFTEMADDTPLLPTDVVHQAVVKVDEKGTVAAAATAMMMAGGAPAEPPKFTVDRPFFFVIADTTTGAPLFLGRVLDPAA